MILILASQNPGKLREIQNLLPSSISLRLASDYSDEEPLEDGVSFQENAALKARFWQKKTGYPALADDSGICIEALQGKPGVASKDFIAHWGGREAMFEALSQDQRIRAAPQASCVCVLALALSSTVVRFYEGRCEGTLVFPPRGLHGYGYDPIFCPQGSSRTFAEMDLDQKNKKSHRAQALQKFLKDLQDLPELLNNESAVAS